MEYFLLYCFSFGFFSLSAQVNVRFITTSTSSYCQGAPVSLEEREKLQIPIPTKTILYIYSYQKSNTIKYDTISSGNTLLLKQGKYLVSFTNDLNTQQINYLINEELYPDVKLNSTYYFNRKIIKVTKAKKQEFTINYHHYCPWELNPDYPVPGSTKR